MRLTKDEFDLLCRDREAFLVRAYISYLPTTSVRKCAEAVEVKRSKCHSVMRGLDTKTDSKADSKKRTSKGIDRGASDTKTDSKADSKKQSLTCKLRDIFAEKYREITGMPFCWNAKEMKAIIDIGNKITFGARDKGSPTDEDSIADNFKILLSIIRDEWILKNFSASIINSKYNEIISQHATRGANASSPADRGRQLQKLRETIKTHRG